MATTTNYSWDTPDDTDLVKDGAAAIRTLGSSIDTTTKALNPSTTLGDIEYRSSTANTNTRLAIGTTGQVLAVVGGVPAWATTADQTPLTTKGDLFTFDTADARLAVGNNGETLVADSSTATGLKWAAPSTGAESLGFTAGKNKIINGDFYINQRGFTSTTTSSTYGQDRWQLLAAGGTSTYSAETFTPGTAPVAGYEGKSFARLVSTGQSAAADRTVLTERIEDVRTFAGQTVILSFWAKASTGTPSVAADFAQGFGTSGSSTVNVAGQKIAITSSWARYSLTFAIPSISGKTIGTANDQLQLRLWTSAGSDWNTFTDTLGVQSVTIDLWGVQVEAGSTATAFQTATGTIQGELAACQRYYYRQTGDMMFGLGMNASTTVGRVHVTNPVSMRVRPTAIDYSLLTLNDTAAVFTVTSATLNIAGTNVQQVACTVASGLTQYRTIQLESANAAGYVGFSAEL